MSDQLSRPLAQRVADLAAAPAPVAAQSTPNSAREAAIDALQADKTHYTTRPGIVPLREWVAGHIQRRYGLTLSVDAITITCGAQEAEFVTLKTLVPAGSALMVTGGAAIRAALEPYAPLLGIHLTAAPDDKVRAVYIGEASAELEAAFVQNVWVIWPTHRLSAAVDLAQVPDAAARTVLIGEFEDVLPGWRVGWMAGSEQAAALRAYKQSMTICSPSVSQWAAYGWVSADDAE